MAWGIFPIAWNTHLNPGEGFMPCTLDQAETFWLSTAFWLSISCHNNYSPTRLTRCRDIPSNYFSQSVFSFAEICDEEPVRLIVSITLIDCFGGRWTRGVESARIRSPCLDFALGKVSSWLSSEDEGGKSEHV